MREQLCQRKTELEVLSQLRPSQLAPSLPTTAGEGEAAGTSQAEATSKDCKLVATMASPSVQHSQHLTPDTTPSACVSGAHPSQLQLVKYVSWDWPAMLRQYYRVYTTEGKEEAVCEMVSDEEIEEADKEEVYSHNMESGGSREGDQCSFTGANAGIEDTEAATLTDTVHGAMASLQTDSMLEQDEPPPLKKQKLCLSAEGEVLVVHRATQCPSDREEEADDGRGTLLQALPRECAREHALVPNIPPCRIQDNQSDTSDGDDRSDDEGQGPLGDAVLKVAPVSGHASPQTTPTRHAPRPQTLLIKHTSPPQTLPTGHTPPPQTLHTLPQTLPTGQTPPPQTLPTGHTPPQTLLTGHTPPQCLLDETFSYFENQLVPEQISWQQQQSFQHSLYSDTTAGEIKLAAISLRHLDSELDKEPCLSNFISEDVKEQSVPHPAPHTGCFKQSTLKHAQGKPFLAQLIIT